jgi:hypothetical protein
MAELPSGTSSQRREPTQSAWGSSIHRSACHSNSKVRQSEVMLPGEEPRRAPCPVTLLLVRRSIESHQ